MKFKSEFANAVKLFVLLILLFWSFTWNSDPYLDFTESKPRKVKTSKISKEITSTKNDTSVWNQHSVLIETFSTAGQFSKNPSKTVSTTGSMLPPFNEWKEMERIKYEKLSSKNATINHHKKTGQRKLNYASEKCGAKILASNPEARHRIAILNEKPDEYMLNPCRVRMWFIIELCDTVEATQVELANYELYSSSPRQFSVFWSEVYPTSVWHLLGTFEAKDQRTMQTFHLKSKNLGKFIKVVLYSHHGKEHYCLLSVIRVLGYSMVEKLEDIEENEKSNSLSDNQSGAYIDKNSTVEKEINLKEVAEKDKFGYLSEFSEGTSCVSHLKYCAKQQKEDSMKVCPNKLACRFLKRVFYKNLTSSDKFHCSVNTETQIKAKKEIQIGNGSKNKNGTNDLLPQKMKTNHEKTEKSTRSTLEDILKDYKFDETSNTNINSSNLIGDNKTDYNMDTVKLNFEKSKNSSHTKMFNKEKINGIIREQKVHKNNDYEEKSSCKKKDETAEKPTRWNKGLNSMKESEQDLLILETDVDSAGLIQKESVLFKLTTRIKASEIELDLINKYLQQLSQSYRQQMEDMQAMFNQTIRVINAVTEKALLIDGKQQESIDILQRKTVSLSRKVDYLMNGERYLLKRVFEMHAFFLILEIIIISTIFVIFTIFMNIFHHKNILMNQRFPEK